MSTARTYRVEQVLLDGIERQALTLTPEELGEIWDMVETHADMGKQTIKLAERALSNCRLFAQRSSADVPDRRREKTRPASRTTRGPQTLYLSVSLGPSHAGFKEVKKKPVIKAAAPAGAEISPLRPAYVAKEPPCSGGCPSGADIRGWLTAIAQAEAYGRTNDEAYRIAWGIITDRNPFPAAVCGRVCPYPCEDDCSRRMKDSMAPWRSMRSSSSSAISELPRG